MQWQCAQNTLSLGCTLLGRLIGRHPMWFLLTPILFSATISIGYLRISYERDTEKLYTMSHSNAREYREIIDRSFPLNTSENFDISRLTTVRDGMFIIFVPKDGGSILRKNILDEIVDMNKKLLNLSVWWNGKYWKYEEICAKSFGKCVANIGLELNERVQEFNDGKFKFKYPVDVKLESFKFTPYVMNLGGVTLDHEDYVLDAKAFRLQYYYDTNFYKEELLALWEKKLRETVEQEELETVALYRISYRSVEEEVSQLTADSVSLIGLSAFLMVSFAMITCLTTSWVRSKPWLGLVSCISACLAVNATFGTVMLFGVKYTDAVIALPFLMTGMGMDDSFVLISAWRRTNPKKSVEKRMGKAFSEAAVSVTVTSLTNFLSFCFGIATPFLIVQIFCTYAATAVFYTYVYQITFFGSCMAFSGSREERGENPFTCTVSHSPGNPSIDATDEIIPEEDAIMKLFRDKLGNALSLVWTKASVISIFFVSLGIAVWGCTHMEEGMEVSDVLHPDSSSLQYMKLNYLHFGDYNGRIQIAINTTLNYADPVVQQKLEDLVEKFEASPYIKSGFFTEFWLKFFLLSPKMPFGSLVFRGYNFSIKEDFIQGLEVFLKFPQTHRLRRDVIFNENRTEIVKSRFLLTIYNCETREKERELFEYVLRLVKESDIPLVPFCVYFLFNEQMLVIKSLSIQTIGVAAFVMLIIFFMFIPDITCALCVAATIVSVEVEAIGYMSLWGVNLDILSMISLVTCVGLSVNYPAHMAYAYITSGETSPNQRLKKALYAVGMPIFQGSTSTVLAIAVLAFVRSYTLLVFLKTIFLIVAFTAFHAMFVLPVSLSVWEGFCKRNERSSKSHTTFAAPFLPVNNVNSSKETAEHDSEDNKLVNCENGHFPKESKDDIWIKRTNVL